MSSAALLKHPIAYMTTEGPAGATMSNFMTGFPPAPIFGSPQYFTRGGRAGDPGIPPFFVPNQAAYALPEFPVYSPAGHYGNIPYSVENKPVGESHEIAVNALLALNSKSACSTPPGLVPDSTPTSSAGRTFSEDHSSPPDLISALRMSASAYPHAEAIAHYEAARSAATCLQDYPDVKPIIPNYGGADSPMVSPSLSERSPGSKPRNKAQSKSGNNICQICGKSYARPSTLKTHMRTHSGEKPYRCEVCGKAFTQAANLTAHLRTHSGEKPFSCPICQKRFSQSSSVTTHLRTHSGERPYRCDFCGKAFADTSTLTKHKRIHSGEKPYRCKICNLGFSQSGNLHRHMKTHNN